MTELVRSDLNTLALAPDRVWEESEVVIWLGVKGPTTPALINRKATAQKEISNLVRDFAQQRTTLLCFSKIILKGLFCAVMSELRIHLEFSGGAELLVGKTKHHDIALPHQPHPWSLRQLIAWIRDNLLKVNLCCDTKTPGRLSNCKLDLLLLPTSQFAIFISGGSRGVPWVPRNPPFCRFVRMRRRPHWHARAQSKTFWTVEPPFCSWY